MCDSGTFDIYLATGVTDGITRRAPFVSRALEINEVRANTREKWQLAAINSLRAAGHMSDRTSFGVNQWYSYRAPWNTSVPFMRDKKFQRFGFYHFWLFQRLNLESKSTARPFTRESFFKMNKKWRLRFIFNFKRSALFRTSVSWCSLEFLENVPKNLGGEYH